MRPQQKSSNLIHVLHGLVERLQPYVAQGNLGVGIVLGGHPLQHPLEFLLPGTPFVFSQMQVANQRPGVGVILVDLQGFLVPIGGFVDQTSITG